MQEELSQSDVRRLLSGDHVPQRVVNQPWRTEAAPMVAEKPAQRARGALRERSMNKGEQKYAIELGGRQNAGLVAWFAFEAVKLRLADNTFFTPDFLVMRADGQLEFHEVKGRSGETYWCEEDAKLKLKIAAAAFPMAFKIVWPAKGGGWSEEAV